MIKRISLKDIAKEVGVSPALVSYVLNEKNINRINKVVAQKIRDTASHLNYRTNQIARSLKTNRTDTIGFIVSDIANPFSSILARIIEDEAAKNNITVLFGSSDEQEEKTGNLINTFLNRQVDGLIIAPGEHTAPQINWLLQQQIPFVLIDRYFPDMPVNFVVTDNVAAAAEAIDFLIANGHRRIGMVGYDTTLHNLNERTKGYIKAIKKIEDPNKSNWLKLVTTSELPGHVAKGIDEMLNLQQPVTALLFASNEIGLYGAIHLNRLKIKVPSQLAVITFDELIAWDLFNAPLTCIRQPLEEMGALAMKILLENIEKPQPLQQVSLPATLIKRASTI